MNRNKNIVYAIVLFLATILQKSLFPVIFNNNFLPNFFLMLILAWTIVDGFDDFLWWAIFAGLINDFLFFTPVGTHVIIFVSIIYFVSFFSRRFLVDMHGTGILLVVFFIIVATLSAHLILSIALNLNSDFWRNFVSLLKEGGFVKEIVLNLIIFFICFTILRKTKKSNLILVR